MIPTVTSYFVIASGISSGNIYGIYVLTFYSGIKSDILFLHSIWHLFWHLIWHLSSIYSGIFSGILSDSFWYSIWHLFWHSFWHLFCGSIWHFIWHSILHSIQHLVNRFWHSLWHGHCRTSTASRSRCPAVPTVIWSLQEEEEEEEATLIKSRDLHLAGGSYENAMQNLENVLKIIFGSFTKYTMHPDASMVENGVCHIIFEPRPNVKNGDHWCCINASRAVPSLNSALGINMSEPHRKQNAWALETCLKSLEMWQGQCDLVHGKIMFVRKPLKVDCLHIWCVS